MGKIKIVLGLMVAVVMFIGLVGGSVSPVNAMTDDAREAFIYQQNGEKCVFARYKRSILVENEQPLPIGLSKTLAKCEKYKNYNIKPASTGQRRLLGFFE